MAANPPGQGSHVVLGDLVAVAAAAAAADMQKHWVPLFKSFHSSSAVGGFGPQTRTEGVSTAF